MFCDRTVWYYQCMKPTYQAAITILKQVQEQCGSAALAYWTTPNTILTLSGVRPYCDGVFWDDDNKGLLPAWQKEIDDTVEAIKSCSRVVTVEAEIKEVRPGESYAGYELLFEEGLRYVLRQTELVDEKMYDKLANAGSSGKVWELLQDELFKRLQADGYTVEHANDIASGLLLGYPDKAMLQSVKKFGEDHDPFGEPLMPADIRGADYYLCPQPVYDYPRSLAGDVDIASHEQLWSSILKGYYTSDFHKTLERDQAFIAKAEEIGNIC